MNALDRRHREVAASFIRQARRANPGIRPLGACVIAATGLRKADPGAYHWIREVAIRFPISTLLDTIPHHQRNIESITT